MRTILSIITAAAAQALDPQQCLINESHNDKCDYCHICHSTFRLMTLTYVNYTANIEAILYYWHIMRFSEPY